MNTNPYSAPASSVEIAQTSGEFNLHDPRTVPVAHGINWIIGGIWHLTKDPGIWVAITIVYLLISSIPSAVSYVQQTLGALLSFIFYFLSFTWAGGMTLGCRAQESGEQIRVDPLPGKTADAYRRQSDGSSRRRARARRARRGRSGGRDRRRAHCARLP